MARPLHFPAFMMHPCLESALRGYEVAKFTVFDSGFANEVYWQQERRFSDIDEQQFLREASWVVLSAGMREAVIRRLFDRFSGCFRGWRSASYIMARRRACHDAAMAVFAHRRKIDAVLEICKLIEAEGYQSFAQRLVRGSIEVIRELPYMGPATSYHLAKNIGLDVAKPDRHLLRVAAAAGYGDVQTLCRDIARHVGDSVAVVDLVIWRFATIDRSYVDQFSCKAKTATSRTQMFRIAA